ncbi:MAG: DMT family transporter [Clostridiales bacterium]|nr:DMT family transporter [Candidatus Crickella merdequi]
MSNTAKRLIYSATTIIIWATAFVFTKRVYLSAITISALRSMFAAVFLVVLAGFNHTTLKAPARDIFRMMITGAFGFGLYMLVFNIGLMQITASTSSTILALTPVLTAFMASFIYKEKLKPIGYICIVTAFCGVAIMMLWNGALSINKGILWTLLGVAFFVTYNLMTRGLQMDGYNAIQIVTWAMIAGAIVQIPVAPHMISEFIGTDLLSQILILYLGVACSGISYITWNKAFSYAEKTSEVTNFMFVTPFLSTMMGFALLGEMPDMATFIGGGIIIVSVIVFGLKGK